ncbi:hypothetical protein BM1_07319 [Bipolaris maydis]|nr:hypothetical protein BM1_07319 [Bipolaris maydis]
MSLSVFIQPACDDGLILPQHSDEEHLLPGPKVDQNLLQLLNLIGPKYFSTKSMDLGSKGQNMLRHVSSWKMSR